MPSIRDCSNCQTSKSETGPIRGRTNAALVTSLRVTSSCRHWTRNHISNSATKPVLLTLQPTSQLTRSTIENRAGYQGLRARNVRIFLHRNLLSLMGSVDGVFALGPYQGTQDGVPLVAASEARSTRARGVWSSPGLAARASRQRQAQIDGRRSPRRIQNSAYSLACPLFAHSVHRHSRSLEIPSGGSSFATRVLLGHNGDD